MISQSVLAAISAPPLNRTPAISRGIADSVAYLASDAALRSIKNDVYWPKWDSPWWHMLLLHEIGEAQRIPAPAVSAMVAGLNGLRLHIFPIHPEDAPPGTDLHRDVACHCALGCMAQVLTACGVDVARALPWVPPWFLRYQMADGGLNCDEQAYLRRDEWPSSMVGTIAPFEALLDITQTEQTRQFLARGAEFLIGRALIHGSPTVHNAEEREAAKAWPALSFPRFYFYDVLRGLAALVRFAEASGKRLPYAAIAAPVERLVARAPDGVLHVERNAHAGKTTILPTSSTTPSPRAPASSFALLQALSTIGEPSAALTHQWTAARHGLIRLLAAGQVTS